MNYDSTDYIFKIYQNQEIENTLTNISIPYKKLTGKILSVDKWAVNRKTPDPIEKIYKTKYILYNYSGKKCHYQKCEHIFGSRLDLNIKIDNDKDKFLTLNIYNEIMEITGYYKMSYKLSNSIKKNEGKDIEIYFLENGDICFNVKSLMSFNYGYQGKH